MDYNGAFDYSDVRVVDFSELKENVVTATPNPANEYTNAQVDVSSVQEVVFPIHQANGNLFLQKSVSLQKGHHSLELDMHSWPAGMYVLHLTGANWSCTLKLVKQ